MKRREFVTSSLLAAAASLPAFRTVCAATAAARIADVQAVTGDGREITLRGTQIRDLAAALAGKLLLAGDTGYDDARRILNPSFDKHPALVVQPVNVADVAAAVQFARAHDLLVAVKCGGHSHSGQSTCDRGLMIDLAGLREVRLDAAAKRVHVAGGSLLGAVDQACMAQGLVTPLGTVSHTGVGGLTLGGGFGRLARKYGMSIDNLAAVDVVTADGKLVRASEKDDAEMFWGVRGGGGNFGVVTRFEFKVHPMQSQVVAGLLRFPIAKARDVLSLYGEYGPSAPDELYFDPVMALPPGGAPGVITVEVCYSGPPADAERALAPLRKLGTPEGDTIKAREYIEVQRMNDQADARALGTYLKGGFIRQLSGDLVSALVENFQGDPGRMTLLFFQHCAGATGRVAENATAFAHRYALANMMTVAGWPLGKVDPAPHIEATRKYWSHLEKYTQGFYVNDMAPEATAKDINANYRGNYQRLLALKKKYDPTNLFRLNANVAPTRA